MMKLRLRESNWSQRKWWDEQDWEVPRGQVVGDVMGHESPGHGYLVQKRGSWPVSLEEVCIISQEGICSLQPTDASLPGEYVHVWAGSTQHRF